ncbi:molecular chaperone [Sinorhizobium garamanticum]|uniref:Molecular chaperone n=1 Tax=Sinorhizobium garamanticum TaxID=680247 RepID=A0ABY8D4G5_9HYPH|nr:molecular chaperone [Sinorhizobium garamanticum]WEX85755.1 molecular chaperone [Sinorhizobium garamanticum]
MRPMMRCISAAALFLLSGQIGEAASLRVSPTTVDLIAPDSAATLNLSNEAKRPINVQVRVFRWTQEGGVDRLEPTEDVVASPPATEMQANASYVVRVVRVTKAPIATEESYRVVVDELPDPARRQAGTVSLVVRHSIPVFFRNPDASAAQVSWTIQRSSGTTLLVGRNSGDSRLRLSDLSLSRDGQRLGGRNGLIGYVLGGATMQWPIPLSRTPAGGSITLSAQTQTGPLNASVAVKDR